MQALTLLNNPPALRVTQSLTTSISNNSATTVPFTHAGTIDTYSAFGTATSTYTAPLNGLYLTLPHHQLRVQLHGGAVRRTVGDLWYRHHRLAGPRLRRVRGRGHVRHRHPGPRPERRGHGESDRLPELRRRHSRSAAATWSSRLCMLYLCPYSAGGVNSFTPPVDSVPLDGRVPRLLDARAAHRALG